MDIGKFKDNHIYYDGYEGEGEVIISLEKDTDLTLHIWDGYFEDIFGKPYNTEVCWSGFTLDYQESLNSFSGDDVPVSVVPKSYLCDLYMYRGVDFDYGETASCLELLISFFEYAETVRSAVIISVS